LLLIRKPQESALPAGGDIPSAMPQPVQQRVGVGILIQVDF
jgi:hypothetical protein